MLERLDEAVLMFLSRRVASYGLAACGREAAARHQRGGLRGASPTPAAADEGSLPAKGRERSNKN